MTSSAVALGTALVERRLSHRLLRLQGYAFRVETLPEGYETGSIKAFVAAGPPRAVALLLEELLANGVER